MHNKILKNMENKMAHLEIDSKYPWIQIKGLVNTPSKIVVEEDNK